METMPQQVLLWCDFSPATLALAWMPGVTGGTTSVTTDIRSVISPLMIMKMETIL